MASGSSPGVLAKVWLSDFAVVGAVTRALGEDNIGSAIINTNRHILYLGTNKPRQGRGNRFSQLRAWARDRSGPSGPGLSSLRGDLRRRNVWIFRYVHRAEKNRYLTSAVIDTDNGYVYFATSSAAVVKVELQQIPSLIQRPPAW